MKKLASILSDTRTMAVIMALFAVSIAVATFIENDLGTYTARSLVYNSKWFEILLFAGMLNILMIIFKQKLYKKPAIFTFHISFVIIILGAGITRYFGFEGTMHIREESTSSIITSGNAYLTIQAQYGENYKSIVKPVILNPLSKRNFSEKINLSDKQIHLKMLDYYPSAMPVIVPDRNGIPVAELMLQGRHSFIVRQGEMKNTGSLKFAFDTDVSENNTIFLTIKDDALFFKAPFDVAITNMMDQSVQIALRDSLHRLYGRLLYNFNDNPVVLNNFMMSGKVIPQALNRMSDSPHGEALVFEITSDTITEELCYWGKRDAYGTNLLAVVNDVIVNINYGVKKVELPFFLKLNDFILERYPGSSSPSWYESRVQITDGEYEGPEFRIYMNNILKHKGYRFYQASYNEDEKGTILSVNYDRAGTGVTYAGYLLMTIGMALSLFTGRSRFKSLLRESNRIRESKKTFIATGVVTIIIMTSAAAGANIIPEIDPDHARLFGSILVQDHGGRIKPVNTLSSEVLRKLARQDKFKGMSPDEIFLGILAFPGIWQNENIIKVGHKQINEVLGVNGKLIPFTAFFSESTNQYKLAQYLNGANSKKPAYRSKFDNELIRTDERLNIFYMTYSGTLLNIFPKPGDADNKWYSPVNSAGRFPAEDSVFVQNIIPYYLDKVKESIETGDWEEANGLLNAIKAFQMKHGETIYPSSSRIKLELFYNRMGMFERLTSLYGLIGFLLLVMQFTGIFYIKLNLRWPVRIVAFFIILGFILHTFTLGVRWHISGHAPWSNGYEALTYIAWATVLAGIIFSLKSPITLSTTAILASLILHTAHLSWMDPEITNLVPVLKSYWLIIHVAVITASYGFLGLGAWLAFINLIIMFLENRLNKNRIDLTIQELSNIIEMTLITGLYLLAIGTFLGGVWANESWGRYWGWDPKETWALVTIMVYAFIAHMRLVPGLKGLFGFNLAALLGFSSVIMTYFGVNYYLSGLHSYAKGDPLSIPSFALYAVITVIILAILAGYNQYRLIKSEHELL